MSGLLDRKGHNNYVPWERAFFSLLNDVKSVIDPENFDIVHAHTQVGLLLAHMSGLAQRLPLVASFHETDPHRDKLGAERTEFILRACAADIYLVGSNAFYAQAKSFGIRSENIRRVYMGVESRRHADRSTARTTLHQMFGIDPQKTLITLVGRFAERKQHRRLLDALGMMECKNETVAIFAGSDNSTDNFFLQSLRSDVQNLSDVHMLENVSDSVRNLVIDGTDIGTQPSSAEGLGLAVIEFMMAGVPVLVSDVPGLQEAVEGTKIALTITEDPAIYAVALDNLSASSELRVRTGRRMKSIARARFSIERAASETLDIYANTCERS
jgi:glycosyltransferase involved in cell wall biosynthesis